MPQRGVTYCMSDTLMTCLPQIGEEKQLLKVAKILYAILNAADQLSEAAVGTYYTVYL